MVVRKETRATVLGALAQQLSAGQWAELTGVSGMTAAFKDTGGSSNTTNPYAIRMPWDPVRRRGFFIGSDHGPGARVRYLYYDEVLNAWIVMAEDPAYLGPLDEGGYNDAHGYSNTDLNVSSRLLYRHTSGVKFRVMNLDTLVWRGATIDPDIGSYFPNSMALFPDRGTLIWQTDDTGNVREMNLTTETFSAIGDISDLNQTWNWQEYNSVRQVMLLGAGFTKLAKLLPDGTLTQLTDMPVATYSGPGFTGAIVTDESTGKFLVLADPTEDRELWEYEINDESIQLCAIQPPAEILDPNTAVIVAKVSAHDCTLWSTCQTSTGPAKMFVRKNG